MKKNLKIPGVMAGLVMAAVIATVPAHAGEFSDGNEFAAGEEFTDAIQGNVDEEKEIISDNENVPDVQNENGEEAVGAANLEDFVINNGVLVEYNGTASEVTIPQNVTKINYDVFKNHTELQKVVLDGCTVEIESEAFRDCSGLKTIEGTGNITSIESQAFEGCSALESIEGTETIRYIGYAAFSGCTAFKGFVFTENLLTLRDDAFAGCKSLENIVFPESLQEIGTVVFEDAAVQKLTFLCEYKKGMFEGGTTKELIVTKGDFGEIKEGYSMIGSDFVEMKELEKVTIGPEVTLIGQEVFDGCENLSEVNIEEGKVERIGEAAFRGCKALKEIVLPAKITSIGAGIFANSGIAKVTMDGVTEIPSAALAGCKNLTSFSFDNIKSIGRGSFRDCENLKEVIIPETVEEIQYEYEDSPFENCGAERVVIKMNG